MARDLLELGHVLGRLAHGDVDVGELALQGTPVGGVGRATLGGAGLGSGELLVVRADVGCAVHEPAHGLNTSGDEDVTLAGLDGVGGHADRLQGARAVAVDGHAGDIVHAGEHGCDTAEVVASLTCGLTAAEDDVFDQVGVKVRDLGERGLDDQG